MSGPEDLSLAEAAARYDISVGHLRRLISQGELSARRAQGSNGPMWRVAPASLEAVGLQPRVVDLTDDENLQAQVKRLTSALRHERARAADLDSRLGFALLTVGRLRGRLRGVGVDPDDDAHSFVTGEDLEAG